MGGNDVPPGAAREPLLEFAVERCELPGECAGVGLEDRRGCRLGLRQADPDGLDLGLGDLGHLGPHIGQRRQAEDVQIVGRGGAGVVRVGHAVLHQPHGAFLQLLLGVGQAVDEGLDRLVRAVFGHEGVDLAEVSITSAARLIAKSPPEDAFTLPDVAVMAPPFDLQAADEGYRILGRSETLLPRYSFIMVGTGTAWLYSSAALVAPQITAAYSSAASRRGSGTPAAASAKL